MAYTKTSWTTTTPLTTTNLNKIEQGIADGGKAANITIDNVNGYFAANNTEGALNELHTICQ